MSTRLATIAIFAFLLSSVGGCGKSSYVFEKRSPVRGSVSADGKPASAVIVRFHLVPGTAVEQATKLVETITDTQGKFSVSQNAANDGLAPGKYTVTFFWPSGGDVDAPVASDQLKGRYLNLESSQIRIDVLAESNQLPPFELK